MLRAPVHSGLLPRSLKRIAARGSLSQTARRVTQNMNHDLHSNHDLITPTNNNSKFNRSLWCVILFLLSTSGSQAEPATNPVIPAPLGYQADWRWVKGAVFVPTKYVNEAQLWD
jgi:hypothetical protein